jgi:pyruvate/2-oxoglutarate dehydrogenase complex dihydrolipoamide dehydrogenase (E3) component
MNGQYDYDFAVVGGGSAGYAAARTAAGLGLKTVVIDGAEELGGLCILRGCMPSKALIETANAALKVRRAAEFGVEAEWRGVDTQVVRERKRKLIGEFADYRAGQLADGRFALLRGTAAFTGPEEVEVTLRGSGEILTVSARSLLIATGSVIAWPEVSGLREADVWTSDTVLDATEVPASFVVLGGGAIALEMAHYLEGIGREVTVIQRGTHLLRGLDPDVAEVVQESFSKRMKVHTGTTLLQVEQGPAGKKVFFSKNGETQVAEAAEVLMALGRRAAVDGLALEAAGVPLGRGFVQVSRTLQTGVPHIFAAGDVCGQAEVVHVAIQQGEMAARNAARVLRGEAGLEEMDYRLKLFGVFTEPQAAAVGMNEAEATASGRPWKAASYPFNDHGKSLVMGEIEGFVKMIADTTTGEILGASVVGPEAAELIHAVTVAMHFKCTVAEFARIPFYHPTLSEIWTYPAEELM